MSACEKCWNDAFVIASMGPLSQVEAHHALLKEREATPCTKEEQEARP